MAGLASLDGPAISTISDATLPDETLVMSGYRLDGARLRVWAEGILEDLEPLQSAPNRMQAVVPARFPKSTMLVWPVRGDRVGAPIRVNGATAWWAWPARLTAEAAARQQTLRIMGKNLQLGNAPPRLYLVGPGIAEWLTVLSSCPYCLEGTLPQGLRAGHYRVWAHNGSGGPFGWSEPIAFEVLDAPSVANLTTFRVDDFAARPDDGQDDTEGIQKAVDAASQSGGGIIALSAGTYHIGRPIVAPQSARAGIHFLGAGMGTHDPKTHALSGVQTTLRPLGGSPLPATILRLAARGSTLRNLNVINGNDGMERGINDRHVMGQVAVQAYAPDVTIEQVRFILLDKRPEVPARQRKNLQLFDAALHILAAGVANITVRDCEFHSAGTGIEIGTLQAGHTDRDPPERSTDYVRIERCVFRGYSRGFYRPPENPRGSSTMGARNHGICNENAKDVIVENCDFAGADRRGGLMMNRSILNYNTSIRNVFYARNHCHDVGMVSRQEGQIVNQGEQILFHFRYPHGGYFDVLAADAQSVSVDPGDPRNQGTMTRPHTVASRAGSRILPEVGRNDHWVVFVAAGKGVGQYRVVVGRRDGENRVALLLDRPWRVVPDRSSRVTLTAAFRQNIIYANEIDPGFVDPQSKTAGVLFWYNALENIVAGCTLRHLGYGVGFNGSFRNPACWNLVRDNVAEHMAGMSVECVTPACFMDSCTPSGGVTDPLWQPGSDVNGWFEVGNLFRSNTGSDAPAGIIVHVKTSRQPSRRGPSIKDLPEQTDGGIVMPVIENNHLSKVDEGVVVNQGCCWGVIRKNVIQTTAPDGAAIHDQSGGKSTSIMVFPATKPAHLALPESK
jgi:hypothetical protein